VAEELTGSEIGFIGETNADGRLSVIAISDLGWEACQMEKPAGQKKVPVHFPIHGIYGRVLRADKGFFTNDPMSHPDRVGTPEGHPLLTAFLGVPLRHEGGTFGMIAVGNRKGGYRPRDLEALESLAAAIVPSLLHRRAKEATQRHRVDLDHAQSVAQAEAGADVHRNELTYQETHRILDP
jgi:GAF domain-containing protein